jgi:hypothetical protein
MGAEAKCTVTFGHTKAEGKALLEADALIFRGGDLRLTIPYKQISEVVSHDGELTIEWPEGKATFAVGPLAAKWADKIHHPRTRADKLGIKRGQRVLFAGFTDPELQGELESKGADLTTRAGRNFDAIFYAVDHASALRRLARLKAQLSPHGALWVIRPKGNPHISEADVMKAGKDAGLVDVKVVRYSDTHTAEKYVIPVKHR